MCDWDEDRAADVTELFSSAIQFAIDECENISKEDIMNSVHNTLLESLKDEEAEILIEILQESMKNFSFIIDANDEYEN